MFPILTTTQYDATKYTPLGTTVVFQVESVSVYRDFLSQFTAITGGQNMAMQTFVDSLEERSFDKFKNKVMEQYPDTSMVIGFDIKITEIGREAQTKFMVMTASGTCLQSKDAQMGGMKRNTRKKR